MAEYTILLADDEDTLRTNLAQVLEEEGFNVIACPNGTAALRALRNNSIDAIITDLRMPGVTGMELIDHARKLAPEATIMVVTAFGEVETAVNAMKKGACDYLCKPLIFDELIYKLKRNLAHDDLAKKNRFLREQIKRTHHATRIIGRSPAIKGVIEMINRVAHTSSNVLICGESGTGKEVLARALHYGGVTKDGAFVAVNCGGLVPTLVESELFGYRRGAFTGAETDRMGYFEAADGGTLFLDEIGNLPFVSQSVLLRAIEERAITRVGDNRSRSVDIRIVAATNRDLAKATEDGKFRDDLYYRLNVICITVPPLRERTEDIEPLIDHFVEKYNAELKCDCPGFSPEALQVTECHRWPGNVRELENVVERALIFANGQPVAPADLSIAEGLAPDSDKLSLTLRSALQDFERRHIQRALAAVGNNKVAAADALGIGLSSLYRKLEELGISKTPAETARAR